MPTELDKSKGQILNPSKLPALHPLVRPIYHDPLCPFNLLFGDIGLRTLLNGGRGDGGPIEDLLGPPLSISLFVRRDGSP